MSSTSSSAPPSSASASPSSSSASPTDPTTSPILSSQAALYLYTFLVTLILLLTVSAAIVVRTYFMRRRHRRLIEEAIRNGTYVPPIRTPRTLGTKPVLHDTALNFYDDDDDDDGAGELKERCRETRWAGMMPLAAWISMDEGKPSAQAARYSAPSSLSSDRRLRWIHRRLRRALQLEETQTTEPIPLTARTPPSSPLNQISTFSEPVSARANVAVLICMPSPLEYKRKLLQYRRQSMSTSLPEPDLPPIEFGIATIPFSLEENDMKGGQLVLTSIHEAS